MWKLIEQFIIDHRSEIDLDEPNEKVWGRIEMRLNQHQQPKKKPLNLSLRNASIWKIAAAVIFVFGLGGSLYLNYKQSDDLSLRSLKTSLLEWDQHHSYPELEKQDSAYTFVTLQLLEKINRYELDAFPFVNDYRAQLDQLSEKFDELKLSLQQQGYTEELQSQIDQTYQQKIALLENLLHELEKGGKP